MAIIAISTSEATFPNDDQTTVHVLSRAGFGPRPEDLEHVRAMGLQGYIDEPLHPERIPDVAMAPRLAGLRSIGMSSRQIADEYGLPQLEARRKRKAEGLDAPRRAMGSRCSPTSGSTISTSTRARGASASCSRSTSARRSARACSAGSATSSAPPRRAPATLFYLDNWMSSSEPDFTPAPGQRPDPVGRPRLNRGGLAGVGPQKRGLNENYGRELMELHTLGVDGGYTQKDVTEVARAVTTDFRDVFGEIVTKHLGLGDARQVFPGYQISEARFRVSSGDSGTGSSGHLVIESLQSSGFVQMTR